MHKRATEDDRFHEIETVELRTNPHKPGQRQQLETCGPDALWRGEWHPVYITRGTLYILVDPQEAR